MVRNFYQLFKEGGTWLGMDQIGRVALLTNVYTGKPIQSAGRGYIVIDFLKRNKSALEYVTDISRSKVMYSPFNMCIFEPRSNQGYEAIYFKNTYNDADNGINIQGEGPKILPFGVSGFGNHPISSPFNKTIFGISALKKIVEAKLQPKEFFKQAIKLLGNRTTMYPDDQMQKQSGIFGKINNASDQGVDFTLQKEQLLSSIFVDMGEKYGTRMQTVVLVDYDRNVHFTERTRISQTLPYEWNERTFEFTCNTEK